MNQTYCGRIKKLGDLITDGYFYEQTKRESYDNWIHESNNLVLTGDACHSIPVSCQSELK